MALRFRKSFKLGPGVRLNIGKKSKSLSFGGRGYRYTISTTGRRTRTIGIPGTGLSYQSVSSSRRRSASGARPGTPARGNGQAPGVALSKEVLEKLIPEPGMFAGGAERAYRRGVVAIASGDFEEALANFGKASAGDGENVSDELFLAFCLWKVGRGAEAIPILESAVAASTGATSRSLASGQP